MIIQQKIARRMKSCLNNEDLSINGLAEELGLSKSSVADYLKEKENPRADTIELEK